MKLINEVLKDIREEKYPVGKPQNYGPSIKLLGTLKRQGYTNYDAICDILDNSVDALSYKSDIDKKIYIETNFSKTKNIINNDSYIMICDNGVGFKDKKSLNEALKLGSELEKGFDLNEYLGCYGVGMKLSAISIGKLLNIVTYNGKEYLTGIFDTDKAFESKSWDFHYVRKSNKNEINLIKSYLGNDTGTMVFINKIEHDELGNSNSKQFSDILTKKVGEIFRYYISDNKKDTKINFFINNNKIDKIDPMLKNYPNTQILNYGDSDKNFTYSFNIGKDKNIDVLIKYYFLDKNASMDADKDYLSPNMKNQGIYVLRNNRQILRSTFFNIIKKHPQLNYFRAEMFYDGKYDNIFKTDSKKTGIVLPDELTSKIEKDLVNYSNQVIRDSSKLNKNKPNRDDVDEKIENLYNKTPLTPSINKNKNGDEIDVTSNSVKPKGTDIKRKSSHRDKKLMEINNIHLGERGVFYYSRRIGKSKWEIEFNVDHPFYKIFKDLDYNSQLSMFNVLYSAAQASYEELYGTMDITYEQKDILIQRYFETWSDNLKKIIESQK